MEFWSPRYLRVEGTRGRRRIPGTLQRHLPPRPVGRVCTRPRFAAPGKIQVAAATAPNVRSAPAATPSLIFVRVNIIGGLRFSHHENQSSCHL